MSYTSEKKSFISVTTKMERVLSQFQNDKNYTSELFFQK